MAVTFVSRAEWGATGATETYIADRYSATRAEKTTIQVHHTAAVDGNDSTPNRWDYDEAEKYQRALQWVRPELGPLPYSENVAVSEDLSDVWLFEGRGILKVGAHTAGHNRDGVGFGILGNFDKQDDDAAKAILDAIEQRVYDLRAGSWDLTRLGNLKNPKGWNAWGHRDSAPKSCPGNTLYPMLAEFRLDNQGEPDMAFTPYEEKELKGIVAAMKNQGTDGGFINVLIPLIRAGLVTKGDLAKALADAGSVSKDSALRRALRKLLRVEHVPAP